MRKNERTGMTEIIPEINVEEILDTSDIDKKFSDYKSEINSLEEGWNISHKRRISLMRTLEIIEILLLVLVCLVFGYTHPMVIATLVLQIMTSLVWIFVSKYALYKFTRNINNVRVKYSLPNIK